MSQQSIQKEIMSQLSDPTRRFNIHLNSTNILIQHLTEIDEAVVALELRKNSDIEVSEDGKYIIYPTDYTLLDSLTIYVQNIQKQTTPDELLKIFSKYGSIKDIHFPKTASTKKHAFITFEELESVSKAIDDYSCIHKLQQLTSDNNVNSLKVLSKHEWEHRCKEYQELKIKQESFLLEIKDSISGNHPSLEFEPGVVAKFSNVHPETNSKVLKKVFEIVSGVAFIDYDPADVSIGYVRFKNKNGAHLACSFFDNEYIVQSSKDCCGVLLTSKSDKKRKRDHLEAVKKQILNEDSMISNADESKDPKDQNKIKLEILKQKEEERYWNRIFEFQNIRRDRLNQRVTTENVESEEKPKPLHIVFSNESDEEEA